MVENLRENLLDRIVACPSRVRLVTGPARSGKSTAVRKWYRHVEQAAHPGACLLLVPTSETARWARRLLLGESPAGVLVSPRVMTLTALAGRVLARGPATPGRISPVARQLLLRKILTDSRRQGRLRALAASAEAPGTALAVDRAVAQLKRFAVDPDSLSHALADAQGPTADLMTLYSRYQEILQQRNLMDVAGQMWLARDRLEQTQGPVLPGLEDIRALAVDGFTDLTPTQLDILRRISQGVESVLITLPLADDPRARMWHWTRRTANDLKRRFGSELEEIRAPRPLGDREDLLQLQQSVFRFETPPPVETTNVECLAASNVEAEIRTVARRIKKKLLSGAPAGSVAVLARSIQSYRSRIETIFAEYDIPLSQAGATLAEVGPVRFCLQVCSLSPDFAYRDVLAVLKSSYFRPEALGDFDRNLASVAQRVIREGNVLGGREGYRQGARRVIKRLAARPQTRHEETPCPDPAGGQEVTPSSLEAAADLIDALLAVAEQANTHGPGWVLSALQLLDVVQDHEDPALVARDLRALSRLEELLAELGDDARDLSGVVQALRAATCPPCKGESLVDVLDVLDARAMRWKHVFLIGLNEGVFPQPPQEDPLLPDRQRVRWHRADELALETQHDLAGREMLLFYLALSRSEESLTLSYVEAEAGAASAGSFLQAAREALGQQIPFHRLKAGDLLPAASELASRTEGKLAAVAGLFHRRYDPDARALAWACGKDPQYLRNAAKGIWILRNRWSQSPCGRFDGRLSDPDLLEWMAQRFGPAHVYSASQLNVYAACPWHYFARYVLGLEALIEPTRLLEATDRGSFCHEVLYRMMTALRQGHGPVCLEELPGQEVLRAFEEAANSASRAVEQARPDWPMLWQVQRREMQQKLRSYVLSQQQPNALGTASLHFELAFGLPTDPESQDPAGTTDPVTLDLPGGRSVRLRGCIDRVDRVEFAGQVGLLVIDYKTGMLPSQTDLDTGKNVQLALYLEAVQKLLDQEALGGVLHQVLRDQRRCFGPMKYKSGQYVRAPGFGDRRQEALEAAERCVGRIADGDFSLYPLAQCVGWCPYRAICQHSPARQRIKQGARDPSEGPEE